MQNRLSLNTITAVGFLVITGVMPAMAQPRDPASHFWQTQQNINQDWRNTARIPQSRYYYPPGYNVPRVPQYKQGEDVRQAQNLLKRLGYYNGTADGVQGPGTSEAVRRFQAENGLNADGVLGPATRAVLEQQSGTVTSDKILTVKTETTATKTVSSDPISLDDAPNANAAGTQQALPTPATPDSANPINVPVAEKKPAVKSAPRLNLSLDTANPQAAGTTENPASQNSTPAPRQY